MRLNNPVKNDRQEIRIHRIRLNILTVMVALLSVVLLIRLAYLQIAEFKRYETLSLKNQMSIIPIAPPRGIILDKNGIVLAENIPVYVLEIIPERVSDMNSTIARLRKLLPSISDEDVDNFKRTRKQNRSFVPIPIKLKLTQEEVATFAIHQYQFTGVSIKARLMRYYPLGEVTAHLLGYVGRINVQELQQVDSTNYRATNFIGKSGIEKYYENILHGQVGYQQVETDVSGRTVRVLNKQNPVSGEKLYLTVDIRLQKIAYEAMKDKRGAVVVMSARHGDILTMVSSPSYDPNVFVNGIKSADYQKLSDTRDRPLYNRAVRGLYPPASTVKPYVGLAGLEKGVIDTGFSVYDPGWFRLPGVSHAYRDWKKGGHGMINLKRAITVSCDTYFYQLGHKLGIAEIEKMLSQFGFGQMTQVDLYEEAPGILPSAPWKRRTKGVSWYPGDTLITAIGQGFMLASPLQLANAVATMSQHGQRYRPHLLLKSVQSDKGEVHPYQPIKEKTVKLNEEANWDIIIDAMHAVTTSNEGTGYRFGRNPPYSVAAKTGTAQVFGGRQYEKRRNQVIPEHLRDHSLFIAFAPVENPEVAIAVMVENDVLASNVARKVLDAYFEMKKSESPS
ncbi:penicillin-binding protein 2 [Legionella sp. MW5194]|uniref:penicillin-binding protein 2 n=1 Tax=Legionella sp. MW5194 TaxID=2662448 RepID=UPI00193E7495|nr:penicillin-binding protein 2 [Legionella sp. MW5194]QRN03797.1 penicillin-binding protein 2 [Legionella sp. MW5194]